MVVCYKVIAVTMAYAALWSAVSRWRVRAPERQLQLQLYGVLAVVYSALVLATGGVTPAFASPLSGSCTAVELALSRTFFGLAAVLFLVLGSLEIGLSLGFLDPSLPILSRWWVRALFEGPVWRLLCRRCPGMPIGPDEAEACIRHCIAAAMTTASGVWAFQVSIGYLEWGHLDPVALVILLKAANIWLDARIRPRQPELKVVSQRVGCSLPG